MKIVIAGANSGIGSFLVDRLINAGHQVWGLARSAMQRGSNEPLRTSVCDVVHWDDVVRTAELIAEDPAWGQVHALILCAGRQHPIGPTVTLDPLDWSATVRVNLEGTLYMIRAFYDLLRKKEDRRAKILCFSGGGATKARPNFSAYAASKTAVVRLVETLAQEWANCPVDINAIAPGSLPTRMTEEILESGAAAGQIEVAAAQKVLSEGRESFERVGDLVDFLLSPKSDGITGKLISARWDPWHSLHMHKTDLETTDIYTLRRILPQDRGKKW